MSEIKWIPADPMWAVNEESYAAWRDLNTGHLYWLMHTSRPVRWYISRVDRYGTAKYRTIIYGSSNAPGLKRTWKTITGQDMPK